MTSTVIGKLFEVVSVVLVLFALPAVAGPTRRPLSGLTAIAASEAFAKVTPSRTIIAP
jgi:hypothetical protein